MKKQLNSKSFLSTIIAYIGSYILYYGIWLLAYNLISDVVLYVFLVVSCIISSKKCISITEGWGQEGVIGWFIGILIAAVAGAVTAPAIVASWIRPSLFKALYKNVLQNAKKDELITLRNDLYYVYEWYAKLPENDRYDYADVKPKSSDVRNSLSKYGCKTYGDMVDLYVYVCVACLKKKHSVDCSDYLIEVK